jgi:transcriptional regulator with XRE-family HTH domain
MASNDLIARNIRRFREDRQLSIGELSRRAGVAKQTVAGIEAGSGNPTVDTLERLAEALNVTLRAVLSEMGVDVVSQPAHEASWREVGALQLRDLDQVYGSGYVTNSVLRLEVNRGPSHHRPGGRASLRHCYVLEGRAKVGPHGNLTMVNAGDFIRFPAEVPHSFEAVTPVALIFVVTTAPQLTMAGGETPF